MTVEFDAGSVAASSEELDNCTMSRKYVINSPSSCECTTTQQKSFTIDNLMVIKIIQACTICVMSSRMDLRKELNIRC